MRQLLSFALLAVFVGCTSQHGDSKSKDHEQHQKGPHAGHA